MVADFVNKNVADEMGEIFPGLAPVVEQRTALQEDHVHHGVGACILFADRYAAIQPH